jgi:hypothetical protein
MVSRVSVWSAWVSSLVLGLGSVCGRPGYGREREKDEKGEKGKRGRE